MICTTQKTQSERFLSFSLVSMPKVNINFDCITVRVKYRIAEFKQTA